MYRNIPFSIHASVWRIKKTHRNASSIHLFKTRTRNVCFLSCFTNRDWLNQNRYKRMDEQLHQSKTIGCKCPPIPKLRPRQNGRHFADDIFKRIFENENEWISPKISLTFVPKVWINNIPALVKIMAWRRPGDKPLSEQMMVWLLTHICVTRPQWVKLPLKLKGIHG